MAKMIDIHTHILYSVDDGAPDLETALSCLKTVQDCGVTDLFLTPHYIPGEVDNNEELIKNRCRELEKAAVENGITVNLHCGVELYLTGTEEQNSGFSGFRMGKSDYILVETAMQGFPVNLLEHLYHLVRNGFKPILAHPERYIDIMQNITLAEDLIYRNVYLQGNAGSFIGRYGKAVSRTAWELFHKGFYHFIASDYHCQNEDYPLKIFRDLVAENYPDYPVDMLLYNNPKKIITNESVEYINTGIQINLTEPAQENIFKRIIRLFNND